MIRYDIVPISNNSEQCINLKLQSIKMFLEGNSRLGIAYRNVGRNRILKHVIEYMKYISSIGYMINIL